MSGERAAGTGRVGGGSGEAEPAEGRQAGRTGARSRKLCPRPERGGCAAAPGGPGCGRRGPGGSVRAEGTAVTRGLRDDPQPVLGAPGSGLGRNFIWDLAGGYAFPWGQDSVQNH